MAYFVLSRNGEESVNTFFSPYPDQDHFRGGPSHSDNTLCKNQVNRSNSFKSYASRQTYRQTQLHYPRTPIREWG